MRIFNKFIESKKEPSNKNDIWFDGSVVRIYKEEEWYTVTLSKEALEKLVKYAENVKIFKYVDTLPEIGDPSLIYFQKELSDGGIVLVPYVYDGEWKQITNSEVFTETSPFGFGEAENSAVLKGGNNKVTNANEVALGEYNESNNDTRFSIGVGTSDTDRRNAIEVKENGDVYITGIGGYNDDNFNKAKTLKSVIDNKIDKIEGKDLSSNDFTNTLKEKLESLENYDDAEISSAVEKLSRDFNALLGNNASAAIESFNEIIAFLEGIEDSASLDAIVASIQQKIAKVSNGLADTDTKITNLFERVEENEILIEDLQNTKIDKEADDYYPQLAVGLADNLAGVDVVDSEVNFRRSGGGAISDGVARIESIKGNSVVWNQLCTRGEVKNSTSNGISYSANANGVFFLNGQTSDNYAFIPSKYVVNYIAGHKYILLGKETDVVKLQIFLQQDNVTTSMIGNGIFTCNNTITAFGIPRYRINPNSSVENFEGIPSLIDLTKMFGAGNEPTTIEEFYARIPMGVDLNAYNEGEVIHMDVQSIESVGVNQWDEEWENGNYSVNTGVPTTSSYVRSKSDKPIKVLPNTKYYIHNGSAIGQTDIGYYSVIFFYDIDDNFIKRTSSIANSTFTTPQNCDHIRFYNNSEYSTTYKNDICINISDASIDGKYFPYIKRVEDLSIIRKYFPQGMKFAGTAHDEIRYNKASGKWEYSKGKIKSVDLGTLNWLKTWYTENEKWRIYANFPSKVKGQNNLLTKKYVTAYTDNGTMSDISITGNNLNSYIYIKDSSYSEQGADALIASLQGVILYYESNDWEWVELDAEDQFRDLDYQVWNCGTEKAIAEGKSAPLAADITYGFNAIGKIKELEEAIKVLQTKVASL